MNIVIAILLLGILVAVHEFGHFIVAKISGMYVEKFSIGVGPKIASFQKGETEYVFSVIPAGGFVSVRGVTGEDDEHANLEDPRLFQNRPIIHRILFTIAGPLMNFIFAIALLMASYMALGIEVPNYHSPAIIDQVTKGEAADKAGLKKGDQILTMDEKTISEWNNVDDIMKEYDSGSIEITFLRNHEVLNTTLSPSYNETLNRHAIGVQKRIEKNHKEVTLGEAWNQSVVITARMSTLILNAVGDLITRKTAVNDAEGGLSGPVGIVNAIDNSLEQGIWNVITLMSLFSINFGLLNMLPIPALDGSRFLFLVIEGIRGLPVSTEKESLVNFVGFVALMLLMIYVTYNDILRLVN